MRPTEIIFEVTEAPESGYDARAVGHSIFTQGEDWFRSASLSMLVSPVSRGACAAWSVSK